MDLPETHKRARPMFSAQLFACICLSMATAIAGGRPCWDDVAPSIKYQNRHIVAGNVGLFAPWDKNETHSLDVDGMHVSAKLTEVPSGEMVELTVTNCSSTAIQLVPAAYDLVVTDQKPHPLAKIDPTKIKRNTDGMYPPLRTETLEYGQIGVYFLFFEPDAYYYQNIDHTITLSVLIGHWEFNFPFQRKRIL